MPGITDIQPILVEEGSRVSFPEPAIVRSVPDTSFLSRDDVLTVQPKLTGETMAGEGRVVKIWREIRRHGTATERFTLLEKWDGVVLDADAETFTARLLDSRGEMPPQQAVFSRSELSPEEATQIASGASFVWTIGYRHKPSRERISYLYFRRLPPWSDDEIQTARIRGGNVSTTIGWK